MELVKYCTKQTFAKPFWMENFLANWIPSKPATYLLNLAYEFVFNSSLLERK